MEKDKRWSNWPREKKTKWISWMLKNRNEKKMKITYS